MWFEDLKASLRIATEKLIHKTSSFVDLKRAPKSALVKIHKLWNIIKVTLIIYNVIYFIIIFSALWIVCIPFQSHLVNKINWERNISWTGQTVSFVWVTHKTGGGLNIKLKCNIWCSNALKAGWSLPFSQKNSVKSD